ncbi:MAG TPA: hypothetical protein VFZ14_09530 [Burkholderiales bacterium]|nr:hypothetical protein [Burkholderiales bacterium]
MRGNPLIAEIGSGLGRGGQAQLDYLKLMLLQAVVLVLWWPKSDVAQMLDSEHTPRTLAAIVMALGLTIAYHAVRAGAEESLLPGQRGLRAWAHEAALPPARILSGYIVGQLLHSAYLLLLSAPLVLVAFAVSGAEWAALAWCVCAIAVQAVFYRLSGAIIHLALGPHVLAKRSAARALLLFIYIPIGFIAPLTSHLAVSYRALAEDAVVRAGIAAMPDAAIFVAIYAAAGSLAALVLYRLLLRERDGTNGALDTAGVDKAVSG